VQVPPALECSQGTVTQDGGKTLGLAVQLLPTSAVIVDYYSFFFLKPIVPPLLEQKKQKKKA
jgi:hypothetical protein